MDVPLIIAAAFTVASGGAGFGFASMAFGTRVQRLRDTVRARGDIIAKRNATIVTAHTRARQQEEAIARQAGQLAELSEALDAKIAELRAQGRVIAAYRAKQPVRGAGGRFVGKAA
jgi:hypothetical protein